MAKKICLDAGHYGKYNRSPVVKEYWESDMTWKLHLLLKKYLEQLGFEVITTRTDKNSDRGLYNRGAASKGCDLFLSLHSNATGTGANENVDRVDIYAPLSGKGHDIAKKLADCIVKVMGTKQGGNVKTRKSGKGGEYYGVIRGAVGVGTIGLLVEHSFHTCTRSAKWLLDDDNLDKLAKAEAQVIAEHFGMSTGTSTEKVEAPAENKTETGTTKLGKRVLKYDKDEPLMKGDDVKELQTRLNALGHSCGKVDGKYGELTEGAVKRFQKAAGIQVDGEFYTESLKALKAAEAAKTTSYTTYPVQDDDTLWSIAEDKLGNGNRYKEIMKLNGLKNDTIHAGQKLKIPNK